MTEIVFYMKEILDEDKSVCFIHLYPSIVQVNRAKKLSDEPLKLSPSIFLRRGSSDSTVQPKLEITSLPLSVSKLKDLYVLYTSIDICCL